MSYIIWCVFYILCVLIGIALLLRYLCLRKKTFTVYLKERKNLCFVIAHPDDEIMFFFPTIQLAFSNKKKEELFLLCLSNGNNYGEGVKREKEFLKVWSYLGGDPKNYKILNVPEFQDGFHYWDENKIADTVKDFCSKHNIEMIITFDGHGVSKHPNHISVYRGMEILRKNNLPYIIFVLKSINIAVKYMSIYSYIFFVKERFVTTFFGTYCLLKTLSMYQSQFKFYRVLFCIFSHYAYYNMFEIMNVN